MLDPVSLIYYAAICAALSLVAPQLGSRWIRFGIGAAVGAIAASLLPVLDQIIGY